MATTWIINRDLIMEDSRKVVVKELETPPTSALRPLPPHPQSPTLLQEPLHPPLQPLPLPLPPTQLQLRIILHALPSVSRLDFTQIHDRRRSLEVGKFAVEELPLGLDGVTSQREGGTSLEERGGEVEGIVIGGGSGGSGGGGIQGRERRLRGVEVEGWEGVDLFQEALSFEVSVLGTQEADG